jgi:hypothetical protein
LVSPAPPSSVPPINKSGGAHTASLLALDIFLGISLLLVGLGACWLYTKGPDHSSCIYKSKAASKKQTADAGRMLCP